MDSRIQAIIETAIYVDDLDTAEVFYRQILGLKVIGREAGRHVFFQVGDAAVLLVFLPDTTLKGDHLPAHGSKGSGHFAMGIATEAFEVWQNQLRANAVAIEKVIQWPNGGKSLYFRDPAGNSVELVTPGVWGLPSGW